MKWRQIDKITSEGSYSMVLQVKKWWMPVYFDCWYTFVTPFGRRWRQLSTDLKYPPKIENISKENLHYKFLGKYWKI